MKLKRTLALTLILTLLLSLFCGCEKKETQKKKVSSKPKEKTASEIYRQANELLDTLDAREMVQRVKANLTIGATTAEFKIDDTMVAFLEDGKYKSYYRKNDVTVFSVYETLSYSYVDGVYYYSDDEQKYRQNMTPEEFKKSEDEGTITYEMDYFEKVSVSGKKAKTITYSKPKEKNLKDLTEAFDSIITGFFDDGDITDMSGKLVTDENGILLNETLTINGLAHSDGQLGDFTLEFSMERTKTGDEVPEIFAPAEADKFKEVSDIEAVLSLPGLAANMITLDKTKYTLEHITSIEGRGINATINRKAEVEYTFDIENATINTYSVKYDTNTANNKWWDTSETSPIVSGNSSYDGNKLIVNGRLLNTKPSKEELAAVYTAFVFPSIPPVGSIIDAKSEKTGKGTKITYTATAEAYEEWAKIVLATEGLVPDSIEDLGGGKSYIVVDENDSVVSVKIQKSFMIEINGESLIYRINLTRTNK